MGLFGGPPKADPIGELCGLLTGRPWEWAPADQGDEPDEPGEAGQEAGEEAGDEPGDDADEDDAGAAEESAADHGMTHVSGVTVWWTEEAGPEPRVWFGNEAGLVEADPKSARRLRAAIEEHFVRRATAPRRDFGPTAKALAAAVQAGDLDAANALADLIIGLRG